MLSPKGFKNMGNCQQCDGVTESSGRCGQWASNADHQCSDNLSNQYGNNGGVGDYSRNCIDRREAKRARKLAAAQAVCNNTPRTGVVDLDHSAKWYKLRAKQRKLECKMAKADAGCRC